MSTTGIPEDAPDAAPGEHLLTVRRVALPGSPQERDHEPRAHEVPFWYVPR
jgi:hypothetical protein